MMSDFELEISETPSQDEINVIDNGLENHYLALGNIEPRNQRNITIFLRDEDGTIVAGLSGSTYWGWLHIDSLWVSETLRGRGYGKRLMEVAERQAIARGCCQALVDTHSFQALGFYEKLGYRAFGVLDDFPTGYKRYFLCKTI